LHLVVDGTDDSNHRGLMVLSALALASNSLSRVPITILAWNDPAVETAAEALRYDTALNIELCNDVDGASEVIRTASLYVCVAFRGTQSTTGLALARQMGVPILMPIQFPADNAGAEQLALVRAAHDPRTLGEAIAQRMDLLS
jgi:hypothetical protein